MINPVQGFPDLLPAEREKIKGQCSKIPPEKVESIAYGKINVSLFMMRECLMYYIICRFQWSHFFALFLPV